MEIDHVGHHGRADNPDRQIERLAAMQARDQAVQRPAGGGADLERLVEEAKEDDPEQAGDL
jgi:hypothetical protein